MLTNTWQNAWLLEMMSSRMQKMMKNSKKMMKKNVIHEPEPLSRNQSSKALTSKRLLACVCVCGEAIGTRYQW